MSEWRVSYGWSLLILLALGGSIPFFSSTDSAAPVVVAVIDTGADLDHDDLEDRLVAGYDFVDEDSIPEDINGHGTQMAGIVVGSCPTCSVMPLKVGGTGPILAQERVALAVEHAVAQNVDAILVAVGSPRSSERLRAAIELAADRDIPVIAAAGQGFFTQTWYPAAEEEAIAVVALDSANGLLYTSNASGDEELAARAEELVTTGLGGGTTTVSGSSAAAAVVASVVGTMLAADPSTTSEQVRTVVTASSDELGGGAVDRSVSYGVVNGEAALELLADSARGARIRGLVVEARVGSQGLSLRVSGDVVNAGRAELSGITLSASLDGTEVATESLAGLAASESSAFGFEVPAAAGDRALRLRIVQSNEELFSEDMTVGVPAAADLSLPVAVGPPTIEWTGSDAEASYDATIFNPSVERERVVDVEIVADDSVVEASTRTIAAGGRATVPVTWSAADVAQARDISLEIRVAERGAVEPTRRWRVLRVSPDTMLTQLQYAQPNTTLHVVADAPWMTTRKYVPVMVYVPLRPPGPQTRTEITSIDIVRHGPGMKFEPEFSRILKDSCTDGEDSPINLTDFMEMNSDTGVGLIGPLGDKVELTGSACDVSFNHWHVIYRIPVSWLGGGWGPFYYLAVSVDLRLNHSAPFVQDDSRGIAHIHTRRDMEVAPPPTFTTYRKVLRVRRSPGLPKLDTLDHYYDAHVHMYSEHTADTGPLAPIKNFGGPLAMFIESSYALGFVDVPLAPNGYGAYKDQLILTNHNAFYSGPPYDPGTVPFYGPMTGASVARQFKMGPLTAAFPGAQEFTWHRSVLGRFAGEEIDLKSEPLTGIPRKQTLARLGHHFLVYDTEHFEGPWHGGNVTEALKIFGPINRGTVEWAVGDLDNPNPLDSVLSRMHNHNETGFGYAAHPENDMFLWPQRYFDLALGREETAHNSNQFDYVRPTAREFIFKGSQVWNQKFDLSVKTTASGLKLQDPFSTAWGGQFARDTRWEAELDKSMNAYVERVRWGLSYNFAESPTEVFIRKNFMVAGTDAHGDFNYGEDVLSTLAANIIHPELTDNAYGRVRTYVLAHDDTGSFGGGAVTGRQQDAYRRGQSVLTDGPICQWWLDSSARHNPDAGEKRWHDARELFENNEGLIGGSGAYDGGRTMLAPNAQNNRVFVGTRWLQSESPRSGPMRTFNFRRIGIDRVTSGSVAPGPAGTISYGWLGEQFADWKRGAEALVLEGKAPVTVLNPDTANSFDTYERCIANPVWVVPVEIEIEHPQICPIQTGKLNVTFRFPNTISSHDGVFVRPLDATGTSERPETRLVGSPGFLRARANHGLVKNGLYLATNDEPIACPAQPWDADLHAPSTIKRSYVAYMVNPRDVHGNLLNDIGDTFVVPLPGIITDSIVPPPEDSIPPFDPDSIRLPPDSIPPFDSLPPPFDSIPPMEDSIPPFPPLDSLPPFDSLPPPLDSIPPVVDSIPPVVDSLPPAPEDSVPPADDDTGDIGWDFGIDILNSPLLRGGTPIPGMQAFTLDLPPLDLPGGSPGMREDMMKGAGPSPGGPAFVGPPYRAPPEPRLYVRGLGVSTGEAFEVTIANFGDAGSLPGGSLVLETVDADDEMLSRFQAELERISPANKIEMTLDGYCLDFGLGVPPTGSLFRVAPAAVQQQFANVQGLLDAGAQVRDLGLLNPDSDEEEYYHSIRQWALWSRFEGFQDEDDFTEAFLEHIRKNVETSGQEWTDEMAEQVATFTPNRWLDIVKVLERARE